MKKTTAKIEYRDRVPYGYVALEYCDVTFYGARAREMANKWHATKNERYLKNKALYKQNKVSIKKLQESANAIMKQVKNAKPFYRFWYTRSEKKQILKAKGLLWQANTLIKANKELEKKLGFSVRDTYTRVAIHLNQNGFVLTHASSAGEKCITKTEVWTLEE